MCRHALPLKQPARIRRDQGLPMQANDIAMLADMSNYMNNDYSTLPAGYGPANFPHANLQNLFWWDWNANSGDTGGIVENDWVTVRPNPRPAAISSVICGTTRRSLPTTLPTT